MELRQVLRDVRQNIWVALAALVVCVVVGGAAALVPKGHYQASVTVLVQPASDADASNAVPIIQLILPQLPALATDPNLVAAARDTLSAGDRAAGADVSATADPSTDILTISATSLKAKTAADFANAVAKEVNALPSVQKSASVYSLNVPSPAQVPSAPTNPRAPILIGATGFGVILAVFAALWAAGIRRRLSRVTEVKERIGANVLAEIPRSGSAGLRPTELFVKHAEPMAMEAFQELRSNLLVSLPPGAMATIGVTSCDPGEGKTSVATNIAWALASADRHVTAIDCDLRKPALHTQMGVPFGPGVTSRRTADALAHASHTSNPYLDVIPAGIIDRHPSDVVSAHMPLLLAELKERNETVVVDCPPLIGVAETVLLAAMLDMVIVVVDARRFNPERLQQCLLRLDSTNTNVAIVLNRVRFNRKRRDGTYGYGHFRRTDHGGTPSADDRSSNGSVARRPTAVPDRDRSDRDRSNRDRSDRDESPPRPTQLRPTKAAGGSGDPDGGRSGYWQR